jgi:hypothetical protein
MPNFSPPANFEAPQRRATKWLRGAAGLASVCALLGTAACSGPYDPFNAGYDPLVRDGLFQPGHTNYANLSLQVANPGDLVRGSGTTGADGQMAAAAIERYRNDKLKKLPAADLAQVSANNSGDNNSTGGGGGGGGGGQ